MSAQSDLRYPQPELLSDWRSGAVGSPSNKRRRDTFYGWSDLTDAANFTTSLQDFEVPISNDNLEDFDLRVLESNGATQIQDLSTQIRDEVRRGKKRAFLDDAEYDVANDAALYGNAFQPEWNSNDATYFLFGQLPELFPSVPAIEDRVVDTSISNPFAVDFSKPRLPLPDKKKAAAREHGVNGYIKFRVIPTLRPVRSHGQSLSTTATLQRRNPHLPWLPYIPNLPADFGRGIKLDAMDQKIFKFFLLGYCEGRTLLPKHNLWLVDIAPMIAASDVVKHSLMSFASGYVLEFCPDRNLHQRSNQHYQRAIELLSKALKDVRSHEPGKEEGTIASLMLLLGVDIVFWELRLPPGQDPRWYTAARRARDILDTSNPGYRYQVPENVQHSQARLSCSNWVAFVNILADAVTPFDMVGHSPTCSWLVAGERMTVRKIHGGTGASPKLLHMFSQITYLAKLLSNDPDDPVILIAAQTIEERLKTFHQWSDLSPGYTDLNALVSDCAKHLHPETGKVNDAGKLTDLIGHAWLAAAQIYLHCRLYRRPRSHPAVRDALQRLIRCVNLQPFSGNMFTAQSPFFAIFMMALVAIDDDRQISKDWFETVCAGAGDRSSVPPLWESLKRIWAWMDGDIENEERLNEDPVVVEKTEEKALGRRAPWWEQMVAWTVKNEGILSLV